MPAFTCITCKRNPVFVSDGFCEECDPMRVPVLLRPKKDDNNGNS